MESCKRPCQAYIRQSEALQCKVELRDERTPKESGRMKGLSASNAAAKAMAYGRAFLAPFRPASESITTYTQTFHHNLLLESGHKSTGSSLRIRMENTGVCCRLLFGQQLSHILQKLEGKVCRLYSNADSSAISQQASALHLCMLISLVIRSGDQICSAYVATCLNEGCCHQAP